MMHTRAEGECFLIGNPHAALALRALNQTECNKVITIVAFCLLKEQDCATNVIHSETPEKREKPEKDIINTEQTTCLQSIIYAGKSIM